MGTLARRWQIDAILQKTEKSAHPTKHLCNLRVNSGILRRQHTNATLVSGFTLIELMISLTLMSVLLLTLWSFFNVYQKTFEGSAKRITEAQIVRSLQDQLRFDLEQAFVPTSKKPHQFNEPDEEESSSSFDSLSTDDDSDSTADTSERSSSFFDNPMESDVDNQSELSSTANVTFEVTQEKWMASNIHFFGNRHAMIIERYRISDRRVEQHEFQTETDDDMNRIRPPQLRDRVVYAFLNPSEAQREGIPNGLVRLEILNDQIPWMNEYAHSDFYTLLETIRPQMFEGLQVEDELKIDDQPTDFELRRQSMDEQSRDAANRQLEDRVSHLSNQLDYVPEILKLRFRYFDGETWQDRWDSKERKQLPVAVEMGFEVDLDYESKIEEMISPNTDRIAQMEDPREETVDLPENRIDALELDDNIRTAQTLDIKIPNRFLVFLGRSTSNSQSHGETKPDFAFSSEP